MVTIVYNTKAVTWLAKTEEFQFTNTCNNDCKLSLMKRSIGQQFENINDKK